MATTSKATIETLRGLTATEMAVMRALANGVRACTLEQAADTIARTLECFKTHEEFGPSWFVYRGGSHLAVHKVSGGPRVLFVVEGGR